MLIFFILFVISEIYCFGKDTQLLYENEFAEINNKSTSCEYQHFKVFISENILPHKLEPFWKSTGLCPPNPHQDAYKFLLSPDMKQNLFHIGSLPNNGIIQVRIHWLLDLIKIRIFPNHKVVYSFNHLDELVHMLWKNGLQPGFELMGNPSNYFTDFENVTQVYMWRNMIQALAQHYINIFGIDYVMTWNFETWNEPDHHDFDNLNFTTQGFLNYYDACSEGLKLVDQRLHFGGPGGSCRIPSVGKSPLCWALLAHCSHGKNFFTGEIGVRLDFISFHKKGNGSTLLIFEEELETMMYIRENYPHLSKVPFFNEEVNIILFNTVDSPTKSPVAVVDIYFNVTPSSVLDPRWAVFELNNENTNPYLVWKNIGSPAYPTLKQFSLIKNSEEPRMKGPYKMRNIFPWKFHFEILNPGVTLINICKKQKRLYKVQNIQFLQTWNFTLQISWSDKRNRCIATYNIEQSFQKEGPYHQINKNSIIFPSYWHSCFHDNVTCLIRGFYRINAIDYWGNQAPYSKPFHVSGIIV